MLPSSPHEPPWPPCGIGEGNAHTTSGRPPRTDTFCSAPDVKNANHPPAGEKKGPETSFGPGYGLGFKRIHVAQIQLPDGSVTRDVREVATVRRQRQDRTCRVLENRQRLRHDAQPRGALWERPTRLELTPEHNGERDHRHSCQQPG